MRANNYESEDADPASGTRYYLFCDQRGCPERVIDDLGVVVWEAYVEPYGTAHVTVGADFYQPLRFPGHWWDAELGFHYNRFRYYSPWLGRYLQVDPIGEQGGPNVYAYPANPLSHVDLDGLEDPCGGSGRTSRRRRRGRAGDTEDAQGRPPVRREGLTKPSRPPDAFAEPRGRKTRIRESDDDATRRSLVRENDAADTLAQRGYDIEQNPAVDGAHNPDYRINGEVFDCYAPDYGTDAGRAFGHVAQKAKRGQAERVVMNLDDSSLSNQRLEREFHQRRGEAPALREVLGVRDGRVFRIYPRNRR